MPCNDMPALARNYKTNLTQVGLTMRLRDCGTWVPRQMATRIGSKTTRMGPRLASRPTAVGERNPETYYGKDGSQKGIARDGARRQFCIRVDEVVQARLPRRSTRVANQPLAATAERNHRTYLEDEQERNPYQCETKYGGEPVNARVRCPASQEETGRKQDRTEHHWGKTCNINLAVSILAYTFPNRGRNMNGLTHFGSGATTVTLEMRTENECRPGDIDSCMQDRKSVKAQ
jgi:hypothetical protein